ncbi:hypothetical protein ABW20_dc0110271 [Dactylellina cionopaga]|nr:hypothetical protein ABW20_dc0110271 [Dactylellina cionopaga]
MEFTTLRVSRLLGHILLVLAFLHRAGVDGHSWVDELTCASGPFFKANAQKGYIRNYVGRQSTQIDTLTTFRILDLSSKQMVCAPRTASPGQNAGFPKLKATPGDLIGASYLENGHIWQTMAGINGPGANPGKIYWFGTQNPKADRDIASVLKWTMDGKGGDGQGRLLATSDFDDRVCIETGHENAGPGRVAGPCKSYFRLPKDAAVGKDYTVYWLWDYSMHFGPPKPGFLEWYSSCMDIQVVSGKTAGAKVAVASVKNAVKPKKAINNNKKPRSEPVEVADLEKRGFKLPTVDSDTVEEVADLEKRGFKLPTVDSDTVEEVADLEKRGFKLPTVDSDNVEVADLEERGFKLPTVDPATTKGLNRHLRREQLRTVKRAWFSFLQ